MRVGALVTLLVVLGAPSIAGAADCPGNPDAIGTSRVLVVDPTAHPRIGTMQYHETLPLNDHEVVLTFDDGPLPPYSTRILETLASQCVKATYFMIGRMARAYPEMVREIQAAGHSVGTHTQNHPYTFNRMAPAKAQQEMDDGLASVTDALGDPAHLAPFFRIPGLIRANVVENYMASRGIMIWSADFPADDWRHISAGEVMHRALTRLEAKGKGVLLLHDIQPATALMLPALLRELKKRGYHIVHVVPATASLPATATTPEQWVMHGTSAAAESTPQVAAEPAVTAPILPMPNPQGFNPAKPTGSKMTFAPASLRGRGTARPDQVPLVPAWTHDIGPPSGVIEPRPGPANFGYDAPASTPATPSTAPHPDVTGSIGAGPITTSNMPKSGIP